MRPAIYIPFPQAVPNRPVIDRENCAYYIKGNARSVSWYAYKSNPV
jgi:heterodisulfide reductase subunit A